MGVEGLSTQGLKIIGTSLKCQLNSSVILIEVLGGHEKKMSLVNMSFYKPVNYRNMFICSQYHGCYFNCRRVMMSMPDI